MAAQANRHPVLTGAFLLMMALGLGFGAHALWLSATRLRGDADRQVEPWMSPRHVIAVFGLPRDDLAPILGLAEDDTPFATLADLAARRGMATDVLIRQIQDAVDRVEGDR